MAASEQIQANRENAQHSFGPTTEEGRKRSSRNACKHGFTGLSLVVTDSEKDAYQTHVGQYFIDHSPINRRQTQIVQQLAGQHWSLHQIFVQQANTISCMNALEVEHGETADLISLARMLNTLNLYEVRRRRAAKQTEEDLLALQKAFDEQLKKDLAQAAVLYKSHKAQGKPFDLSEFGFVCSSDDLAAYLQGIEHSETARKFSIETPESRQLANFQKFQEDFSKQTVQMEAEVDAMIAKLSR